MPARRVQVGIGGKLAERHLRFWLARLDDPIFVYMIQGGPGRPIKIGVARDVYARIADLQTGHPWKLTPQVVLPGDHSVEAGLHQRFAEYRLYGEWFDAEGVEPTLPEFVRFAEELIEEYDGPGELPYGMGQRKPKALPPETNHVLKVTSKAIWREHRHDLLMKNQFPFA